MEDVHHSHKEVPFGWLELLQQWRRSRVRTRLRAAQRDLKGRVTTPWSLRARPDWSA